MRVKSCCVGAFLVVTAVAGLPALWPAPAAAAEDGQRFRDWVVKCRDRPDGGGRVCVLVQGVQHKDGDRMQHVMTVVIGRFGKDSRPGMLIELPLGVFLPAGVVVKVDGNDATAHLHYQYCNRSGCRAALPLDGQWLDLFRAGTKAEVGIRSRSQKEIALPISLIGFSKGIASIGIP